MFGVTQRFTQKKKDEKQNWLNQTAIMAGLRRREITLFVSEKQTQRRSFPNKMSATN